MTSGMREGKGTRVKEEDEESREEGEDGGYMGCEQGEDQRED